VVLVGALVQTGAGLELIATLRSARMPALPGAVLGVIALGSTPHPLEAMRALERGADDFVHPSVAYLELRARIDALVRRSVDLEPTLVRVGALTIDTRAHSVEIDGTPVPLRRLEFELLLHLARDPERVFAKQELLAAVWGYASPGRTRTLDSHASRLRRKLQDAGAQRWVVNVWGVGYRLT
jgi:DNA-binding response OmpR family regulator